LKTAAVEAVSRKGSGSGGSDESGGPVKVEMASFSKYIILELAENGDLFDFTTGLSSEPALGEEIARFYFH
jgi:hypothetical protein